MKSKTFIFLGKSGSGKGTQIELLKKYFLNQDQSVKIYNFVMGDIYRNFMNSQGEAKEKINEIISQGKLVPDIITNSLFVSDLIYNLKKEDILIIDGVPRSEKQAEAVVQILQFFSRQDAIVIELEVEDQEVKNRMFLRGREDDKEEAIKSRLNYYEDHVVPASIYFKEKSNFNYLKINGQGPILDIHLDIINNLKNII